MSMVIRQLKSLSVEERKSNIELGLKQAQSAVEKDESDGLSWTVLGNAYLQTFFNLKPNPSLLEKAMDAYEKAVSCCIKDSCHEIN